MMILILFMYTHIRKQTHTYTCKHAYAKICTYTLQTHLSIRMRLQAFTLGLMDARRMEENDRAEDERIRAAGHYSRKKQGKHVGDGRECVSLYTVLHTRGVYVYVKTSKQVSKWVV